MHHGAAGGDCPLPFVYGGSAWAEKFPFLFMPLFNTVLNANCLLIRTALYSLAHLEGYCLAPADILVLRKLDCIAVLMLQIVTVSAGHRRD